MGRDPASTAIPWQHLRIKAIRDLVRSVAIHEKFYSKTDKNVSLAVFLNPEDSISNNSEHGSRLDRFLLGPYAQFVAFVWGLGEATVFFLVPDVFLTLIAVRNLRPALKGTVFALSGALIGGAMMYALGHEAPKQMRSLLDNVPGISSRLITRVETEVRDDGLVAILLGPTKGIPYKLYAVDWGARRGDFFAFMLISIPARYARFFLLPIGARAAAHLLKPWTKRRAAVEITLHAAFWIAFYSYYFARFGL